jgi:hypothetical protein
MLKQRQGRLGQTGTGNIDYRLDTSLDRAETSHATTNEASRFLPTALALASEPKPLVFFMVNHQSYFPRKGHAASPDL